MDNISIEIHGIENNFVYCKLSWKCWFCQRGWSRYFDGVHFSKSRFPSFNWGSESGVFEGMLQSIEANKVHWSQIWKVKIYLSHQQSLLMSVIITVSGKESDLSKSMKTLSADGLQMPNFGNFGKLLALKSIKPLSKMMQQYDARKTLFFSLMTSIWHNN